jgi:hypothetical protein
MPEVDERLVFRIIIKVVYRSSDGNSTIAFIVLGIPSNTFGAVSIANTFAPCFTSKGATRKGYCLKVSKS